MSSDHVDYMSKGINTIICFLSAEPEEKVRATLADLKKKYARNQLHDAVVYTSDERLCAELTKTYTARGILKTSARLDGKTTCCVILPHAVKEGTLVDPHYLASIAGLTGPIMKEIMANRYDITAIEMFTLSRPDACDFYEVYKGVVPEFEV